MKKDEVGLSPTTKRPKNTTFKGGEVILLRLLRLS